MRNRRVYTNQQQCTMSAIGLQQLCTALHPLQLPVISKPTQHARASTHTALTTHNTRCGCRYDDALQVAHYSRYRTEKQIADGVQPYEFIRASSVHYLTFNTKALTDLAAVARTLGVDIFRRGLRHGYSLKDAWDFALPHVATRVAFWPWKQVNDEFEFDRFAEVLANVYSALAPAGGGRGPYAYTLLSRDFWTSTDFLARFRGNFLKAVRRFATQAGSVCQ